MLICKAQKIRLHTLLFLTRRIVEHIREMAFAAVLAIVHSSHEHTGTTLDV